MRTNQIMVDTCDWLVCFVRHAASNSRNLREYAEQRKARGWLIYYGTVVMR